jgi:hypothetical protein
MTSQTPSPLGAEPGAERHADRGRVYRRVTLLKRGSVVAAVVGFGAFAGLAAAHRVGVTSRPASAVRTQAQSQTVPAAGGFFAQDGIADAGVAAAPQPASGAQQAPASSGAQQAPASSQPAQAPVASSGAS